MADQQNVNHRIHSQDISRRGFLKVAGIVVIGFGVTGCAVMGQGAAGFIKPEELDPDVLFSKGYLLVDTKKCQGCVSCMLACSLVHEGKTNLSFSRIQVMQNPFEKFPDDITLGQCRQCLEPACIEACPSGALYIDRKNGNVRMINIEECIGCRACVEACPYEPARVSWNHEEQYAQKCDLCMNTPFWDGLGSAKSKQACVAVCPAGAIKFTGRIPVQTGDEGYNVNLRGKGWKKLGYPTG